MKRMCLVLGVGVLACACTPTGGASPQAGQPEPSVPDTPIAEPEQRPRATAPMPEVDDFRAPNYWQWETGEGWGMANARELSFAESSIVLGRLNETADGSERGPWGLRKVSEGGHVLWRLDLQETFVPEGRLALGSDDTLYVTHHCGIASGASVSAVDAKTGSLKWTVALEGIGPVEHSKYRNETQIEVDQRGVVIYGRESQGAYTEILDPETGAQRRITRPDSGLSALEWSGKGSSDPFDFAAKPSTLTQDLVVYTASQIEGMSRIKVSGRLQTSDPMIDWSTELDSGGCGSSSLAITGKAQAKTLWVADYCGIGSGIELHRFDASSGKHLGTTRPRSLGPIGHSEYFNETELSHTGKNILIKGREAYGTYLEVIDPETGKSLVNLTFRDG